MSVKTNAGSLNTTGGGPNREAGDDDIQSVNSKIIKENEVTEEELKAREPEDGSMLTYSQEYYILNREEILAKRRTKEMEAKFGDFSARLVKRPKKNFLWGFGT